MNLKEIKEIALANIADPSTEYFYRFVCRWYSKTFFTPLTDVMSLSPDFVFTAYFEEGFEKLKSQYNDAEDVDDPILIEMLMATNPDYNEEEEESVQEFIDLLEQEELNKKQQSLGKISPPKGLEPKSVSKNYNIDPLEEKDFSGDGLDDLESIAAKPNDDSTDRSRE